MPGLESFGTSWAEMAKRQVLVVDANPASRTMLSAMMRELGFGTVVQTSRAQDARRDHGLAHGEVRVTAHGRGQRRTREPHDHPHAEEGQPRRERGAQPLPELARSAAAVARAEEASHQLPTS